MCVYERERVCVYIRPRRVSLRSYVRGLENGRRSYELALEDNYDGDPGTAIHYALNAVTRTPDQGGTRGSGAINV